VNGLAAGAVLGAAKLGCVAPPDDPAWPPRLEEWPQARSQGGEELHPASASQRLATVAPADRIRLFILHLRVHALRLG